MPSRVEITLPWPPTANHYWRHPDRGPLRGRHLISKRGREYRTEVYIVARRRRLVPLKADKRLRLTILAHPPDRRKRDLDNLLKSVQDALTHARVYEDDSQIDDLRVVRGDVLAPGRIEVAIEVVT